MTTKYFDAHCHLQFPAFAEDREEVIARMEERGVAGVVVGCDYVSSQAAVALAERHEHLYAAIGLHPNHESEEAFDPAAYRALAASASAGGGSASGGKVVAIGECGLDYFRPEEVNEEVKEKQKTLLRSQIALAAELDKALIIHSRPSKKTRDAYHDLIAILTEEKEQYPNLRGDIHFFVGGEEEMRALVALGLTVSYTAVVTFAREYDAAIGAAPLASLLAETDAPYVPPTSRGRGARNDPLAVEDVVAKLAEIRNEPLETVRQATVANATRLFGLAASPRG
ncbi:MAG: TatD family hydrolase [Patescibacteria group bacterium]|nr:TatD family hydrolase [Patescibacteria group bacterium]